MVRTVLTTIRVGRPLSVALMVGALVGAMAAVPLAASAEDDGSQAVGVLPAPEDAVDGSDDDAVDDDTLSAYVAAQYSPVDIDGVEDDMTEDDESANGEGAAENGGTDFNDVDDDATEVDGVDDEAVEPEDDANGLDIDEVIDGLENGQSLADYAAQFGVSEGELVAAIVAEIEVKIAASVASGELTQEQADAMLAAVPAHVAALVSGQGAGDAPIDNGDDANGDDNDGVGSRDDAVGTGDDAIGNGEFAISLEVVAGLTGADVAGVEAALAGGETLAEFAARFGVSEDVLIDALVADLRVQVNAAVASGELTEAQGQEVLANAEAKVTAAVHGDGFTGDGHRDDDVSDDMGLDPIAIIAYLTGATPDDIVAALFDGQNLVEFAGRHGVSENELVGALTANFERHIFDAVSDGVLTEDEAGRILEFVREFVTAFVNGEGFAVPGPGVDDDATGEDGLDENGRPDDSMPGDEVVDPLVIVAELTGTEVADVMAVLDEGQTLAQYAAAYGVGEDVLVGALMAETEAQVAAAIASGDLTQEEAFEILAEAEEFVLAMIHGEAPGSVVVDSQFDDDPCVPIAPEGDGTVLGDDDAVLICPETS